MFCSCFSRGRVAPAPYIPSPPRLPPLFQHSTPSVFDLKWMVACYIKDYNNKESGAGGVWKKCLSIIKKNPGLIERREKEGYSVFDHLTENKLFLKAKILGEDLYKESGNLYKLAHWFEEKGHSQTAACLRRSYMRKASNEVQNIMTWAENSTVKISRGRSVSPSDSSPSSSPHPEHSPLREIAPSLPKII